MIRVLVVDDSSFMRKSLSLILESDEAIQVVGTASDGVEAIQKTKRLLPDVVILDIEMPVMDGLEALEHIMANFPTPVLMLSALNTRDAMIAFRSLDSGAVDFIPKPSGVISYDIDILHHEIIAKTKATAGVNVQALKSPLLDENLQRQDSLLFPRKEVIVLGASTGGPKAIRKLLASLPRDIGAAIIISQHMNSIFLPSFAQQLQWDCSLDVTVASDGDHIEPGHVLIGPGDFGMQIEVRSGVKSIRLADKVLSPRGSLSINCVMESAAKAYGEATLGVLMTGIGRDGALGMKAIKDVGGRTIAEHPSSCVVFGMPKAAIELGCVDEILPLDQIASAMASATI